MQQETAKTEKAGKIAGYIQILAFITLVLYLGKSLFIPMSYGLFIAIVSYPFCKWLENKGIGKSIAIAICITVLLLLVAALLMLFAFQLDALLGDIPRLKQKIGTELPALQSWLQQNFLITQQEQNDWAMKIAAHMPEDFARLMKVMVYATGNALFSAFLVPIHMALFLYHRHTFVAFLYKLAGEKYSEGIRLSLHEIVHTYFNYIKGMIQVYIIVGILNSIGLLALGVKHAILFGLLTAIMTIIPYVGIIVSAAIPVSITYIDTGSGWYVAGIIAVFSFVQYLEANVIFPRVVSTQLSVSTWATFVAIIGGGIIWGVSGMILFIPFVAIMQIVSGKFKELDTLNILLKRN